MNKYAVVNLKGGLANQIFQISFANYLKSIGFKTYLDTSFYDRDHKFPRKLEIDPSFFGFKQLKIKSDIIFKINKSIFIEDDTFEINNLKKYNRFVGYYQNLNYLETSKELLYKKLSLKTNQSSNQNLAALHIRKTDYLTLEQDLKSSYYQLAINKLLKINNHLRFDIFTDDSNIKLDPKIFKNINEIHLPNNKEKPIDVLRSMVNYKYYIIANSSFSTIPAFLSQFDEKIILYPKPWWRNSNIKIQNIPSNWIAIANKL
jgi:hypothetical protein